MNQPPGLELSLGPGLRAGFTDASLDLSTTSGCEVLANQLGMPLVVVRQVHGTDLAWVTKAPTSLVSDVGPADAIATRLSGVALAIRTADCVPVLLADPEKRLIAAVHAGWRGVIGQVVPKVIDHLRQAGANELRVGIGPAICVRCYEVGSDLARQFAQAGLPVGQSRGGSPSLDLPAAVAWQLDQAGVRLSPTSPPCTKCSAGFHSYRASRQAAGRQAGWVAFLGQEPTRKPQHAAK